MAFGHHHHHHHHAHDDADAPLDAANQSLADALRASFNILKFIMFVLIVLYLFSGVQCIEEHEEAVVLRFGKLLPGVREPGLSWAFPFPVDETLRFPAKKSNKFTIKTHWPNVPKGQEPEPLNKSRSMGGLDPGLDGALLTADSGMVHIQWEPTYRVDDLRRYVLNLADEETTDVETLITLLVETAAIRIVSEFTAQAATRDMTADIAATVKAAVNDDLEALETGVRLVVLDIPRSSVPGQTIAAFDKVANAENEKDKDIRDAQQNRSEILNDAAGAAHTEFLALLDARSLARAQGDQVEAASIDERIGALLEVEAGGQAGRAIRRARGFYTEAVQRARGEVQQYEAAIPEYTNARALFVHRMWEQTRERVLQQKEVRKHILSGAANEIRIKIAPDPRQREIDEAEALRKEAEAYDFAPPQQRHAVQH